MNPIPVAKFIADSSLTLPPEVAHQAKRCLTDLIGVLAAGRTTENSRILHEVANRSMAAGPSNISARLPFDGRETSLIGAAMASAGTIDSVDGHDGYNPCKGHAGVAVLPAILATSFLSGPMDGAALLRALVIGYEIACRAGISMHRLYHDYHASGSWNALGVAAASAAMRGLEASVIRHALSAAEFYAPRGLMMPVIDAPDMRKDSATGGAMAGMTAVELAIEGFVATNTRLINEAATQDNWIDLGQRWMIMEQYFKPFPVCRWGHPPLLTALSLRHEIGERTIERIEVQSFAAAVRLSTACPIDTEQAQYSLPFAVATGLIHGKVGVEEITGDALNDQAVLELARKVEIVEDSKMTEAYPIERAARLTITLDDGTVLEAQSDSSWGDPEDPLTDNDLLAKARGLAAPLLGDEEARILIDCAWSIDPSCGTGDVSGLLEKIHAPVPA